VSADAGLHRDRAKRMTDDVVELSRDPEPFLARPATRRLFGSLGARIGKVYPIWMSVIVHGIEGYFIVLVVAVLAGWYA